MNTPSRAAQSPLHAGSTSPSPPPSRPSAPLQDHAVQVGLVHGLGHHTRPHRLVVCTQRRHGLLLAAQVRLPLDELAGKRLLQALRGGRGQGGGEGLRLASKHNRAVSSITPSPSAPSPPSRRYRLPCLNRYCRQLLPPIPPHTPTCRFSISFSNLSASTLCSASRCCAAARGEGSLRTRSSSASTVMLACVHGGAWECMRVHGGHVTGDGSLRIHSIPSSISISACICTHGWCMGAHGCAPTRGGGAHGCTCSTALSPHRPPPPSPAPRVSWSAGPGWHPPSACSWRACPPPQPRSGSRHRPRSA